MRSTNVGHSAFGSLAELHDELRNSYQAAMDVEQGDTSLTKSETVQLLKEAGELFVLGIDSLTSIDGDLEEVKNAVACANDAEREVAALRAEKARIEAVLVSQRSKPNGATNVVDVEEFVAYAKQLSELHEHLSLSRSVFKAVLKKSLEDIRDERLSQQDQRFTDVKSWGVKKSVLERMLQSVRVKAAQLNLSAETYLDEDEALFLEVMTLAAEASGHVRRGEALREARDAKLKVFFAECAKLTGWCRQQLTNLEAMKEPDHVQEYCATLAENYPTMSSNFALLFESVREYVQANLISVHKALLETEEVWVYLQVSTLQRLSRTLFEIHPKSPLDVEVEKYSGYPERVEKFLRDLEGFVAEKRSQRSDVGELNTIQKECQQVRHALSHEYGQLSSEVHAFAQRAQALRLGYQCFREALLQRLTYVSPVADTVLQSKRRQEEFLDCVRELKSWAAEVSHGESWRDIYSKIVEIKQLIKSEQSHLEQKKERAMAST